MIPTNFSFSAPCARRFLGLLERCSFPLTAPGGAVGAGIFTLCMSLAVASTPLRAMEWTAQLRLSLEDAGGYLYSGEGAIDENDAQKLEELYASKRSSLGAKLSGRSIVRLNSPGGGILGGMQLGEVIRKLGLETEVPASAGCYSACTFAFLGGVERQIKGEFGIHALSLAKGTPVSDTTLDSIQRWGSFMVQYARELVGKSDMAEAALRVSASDISLVPDDLLRDWNIITIAARPSQLYPASELHTLSCGTSSSNSFVKEAVCNGLGLARLDRRITAALAALRTRPSFDRIELEQRRWSSSRDQCEDAFFLIEKKAASGGNAALGGNAVASMFTRDNKGNIVLDRGPLTGTLGVNDCLYDLYDIRAKELEALVAYFEAGETTVAKKGWKTPSNN